VIALGVVRIRCGAIIVIGKNRIYHQPKFDGKKLQTISVFHLFDFSFLFAGGFN
jgi:hypothetical protein